MQKDRAGALALRYQCLVAMWVARSTATANVAYCPGPAPAGETPRRTTHRVTFDQPGRSGFLRDWTPSYSTVQPAVPTNQLDVNTTFPVFVGRGMP